MTDDALLEAMARAISDILNAGSFYDIKPDLSRLAATAVLAALRQTHAVVPREPSDAMLRAAQSAWTPGVSYLDAHAIRYHAILAAAESDDGR